MEQTKRNNYNSYISTSSRERDLVIAREEVKIARYLLASEVFSKVVRRERNYSILDNNNIYIYSRINKLILIILFIYQK